MNRPRSHIVSALLLAAVIALGLISRAKVAQTSLPPFINDYVGDTLYALMVFLGIGWLFPTLSTWRVAAIAFGFSLCIECSQLYHAPWLDAIRQTRLGGLILGFGFLWSDLLCYAVGVACGVGITWLLQPLVRKR